MDQYLNYNTPENSFLVGYVECALWTTYDESNEQGGNPMDQNYSFDDIAAKTIAQMTADCKKFQDENAELLSIFYQTVQRVDDADVEAYAGRDFWLSRNGHGAGFFDRDDVPRETRELLQLAADNFGEIDLYVGDDGEIYQ